MVVIATFFKDTLKKTSFYILSDQFKHIGKGTNHYNIHAGRLKFTLIASDTEFILRKKNCKSICGPH